MTALIGYLMLFAIMFLLMKNKMMPIVIFVTVPVIAALLLGNSFKEIGAMVDKGLGTVWKTAVLFIFSTSYFGLMNDAGMFDPIVEGLVKRAGSNVVLVTVASGIVAILAHLDGATVLKMDTTELWHMLIPFQGVCLVVTLVIAAVCGVVEKKRGAGVFTDEEIQAIQSAPVDDESLALKRPKLFIVNIVLTLVLVICLCFSVMPSHTLFMIFFGIAITINYPGLKNQQERFKAHASESLNYWAKQERHSEFHSLM